jgi:hypothetical protein
MDGIKGRQMSQAFMQPYNRESAPIQGGNTISGKTVSQGGKVVQGSNINTAGSVNWVF